MVCVGYRFFPHWAIVARLCTLICVYFHLLLQLSLEMLYLHSYQLSLDHSKFLSTSHQTLLRTALFLLMLGLGGKNPIHNDMSLSQTSLCSFLAYAEIYYTSEDDHVQNYNLTESNNFNLWYFDSKNVPTLIWGRCCFFNVKKTNDKH